MTLLWHKRHKAIFERKHLTHWWLMKALKHMQTISNTQRTQFCWSPLNELKESDKVRQCYIYICGESVLHGLYPAYSVCLHSEWWKGNLFRPCSVKARALLLVFWRARQSETERERHREIKQALEKNTVLLYKLLIKTSHRTYFSKNKQNYI